ncbi:MAG: DUF922 domain-containing protein [Hyphomicrobiaceae bacterium]
MHKRFCNWLAMFCLVFFAGSFPALAGVNFTTSVQHYELGTDIERWQDIYRAIKKWGPYSHRKNTTVFGQAEGDFKWKYKVRRDGNLCSISNLDINVHVELRLPEWLSKYASTDGAQEVFSCVSQTVTTHENRHAEIWRETANKMHRAAKAGLTRISCHKFEDRAGALLRNEYRSGSRRQAKFDTADYKRPRYQKCWKIGRQFAQTRQVAEMADVNRTNMNTHVAADTIPEVLEETSTKAETSNTEPQSFGYVASFGLLFLAISAAFSLFLIREIANNSDIDAPISEGPMDEALKAYHQRNAKHRTRRVADVRKKPNAFGETPSRQAPSQPERTFGQRS